MARRLDSLIVFALTCAACGADDGTSADPDTSAADTLVDDSVALEETGVPDATSLPDVSIGIQPIGGICQLDGDCSTGYCNTFPSGGYCTQRCGSDDPACPDGSECVRDTDSDGAKRNICLKSCLGSSSCRSDQFCPQESMLCVPRCQEDSCSPGYRCNFQSGRCVLEGPCEPEPEVCDGMDQDCNGYVDEGCGPDIARPPHVVVHDLGATELGGGGLTRDFTFLASSSTASFTIVALAMDHPEDYLQLYSLHAPDGTDLMGNGDPYAAPNRAFPAFGAYTVQVPNTDAFGLSNGRYDFNVFAYPDEQGNPAPVGDGWLYVVENKRVGATSSKLDANFWFVGIPGLDASKAQANAKFTKLLTAFEGVLANAGIELGTVRYFDVTGDDAQRYTIVDTGDSLGVDEHAELLAKTASLSPDNWGVSFFFVQGFSGWELLGKAGGIPGPPMIHGTYNSGVVVSLADYLHYPDENLAIRLTAETMAHEMGHQLGLYHTTEADGQHHDHVTDTLECGAAQYDKNHDGLMDPNECLSRGALNLMFWTASLETQMTAGQRSVLHKNPTLRD